MVMRHLFITVQRHEDNGLIYNHYKSYRSNWQIIHIKMIIE